MTRYWIYFSGIREMEIDGDVNNPVTKIQLEDNMWQKYGIYADEITRIRSIEKDETV